MAQKLSESAVVESPFLAVRDGGRSCAPAAALNALGRSRYFQRALAKAAADSRPTQRSFATIIKRYLVESGAGQPASIESMADELFELFKEHKRFPDLLNTLTKPIEGLQAPRLTDPGAWLHLLLDMACDLNLIDGCHIEFVSMELSNDPTLKTALSSIKGEVVLQVIKLDNKHSLRSFYGSVIAQSATSSDFASPSFILHSPEDAHCLLAVPAGNGKLLRYDKSSIDLVDHSSISPSLLTYLVVVERLITPDASTVNANRLAACPFPFELACGSTTPKSKDSKISTPKHAVTTLKSVASKSRLAARDTSRLTKLFTPARPQIAELAASFSASHLITLTKALTSAQSCSGMVEKVIKRSSTSFMSPKKLPFWEDSMASPFTWATPMKAYSSSSADFSDSPYRPPKPKLIPSGPPLSPPPAPSPFPSSYLSPSPPSSPPPPENESQHPSTSSDSAFMSRISEELCAELASMPTIVEELESNCLLLRIGLGDKILMEDIGTVDHQLCTECHGICSLFF